MAAVLRLGILAGMFLAAGGCISDSGELVETLECDDDGGCPLGLSIGDEPWVVACGTALPSDVVGETIWTGAVSPGPSSGEWTAVKRVAEVDQDIAVAVEGSVVGCKGGGAPILAVPLEDREPGWPEREVERKELLRRFER